MESKLNNWNPRLLLRSDLYGWFAGCRITQIICGDLSGVEQFLFECVEIPGRIFYADVCCMGFGQAHVRIYDTPESDTVLAELIECENYEQYGSDPLEAVGWFGGDDLDDLTEDAGPGTAIARTISD